MKRLLLVSLLTLAPMLAFAQQVDLTKPLTDENGQPMTDCVKPAADGKSCAETKIVTVGYAVAHALFALSDAERNISGDERWKRGDLGLRISHEASISLTIDEARIAKECIGKVYPPLIVAQLFPLLDPNIRKDAPKQETQK